MKSSSGLFRLVLLSFSLLINILPLDGAITWLYAPKKVDIIQGNTARFSWNVDVGAGRSWGSVTISRNNKGKHSDESQDIILRNTLGDKTVYVKNRENDIELEIKTASNLVNITFVLANITIDDEMYYGITMVNNGFERSFGPFIKLTIFVCPKITALFCQGCQNGSAAENQTITLVCNATGKPMPNIRWMKNGEHYNGSSSLSSSNNALVFQQVAIHDKGNYTCIADNGVGNPDKKSLTLLVKYKPTNTLLSPTKLDVCENTDITLKCTADAYPSVKNYSLYDGNTYIGSSSNGQLSTTPISLGWNKFCCVASNEIGSGQCAFSDVHVLDKPENTGINITPDKKDFCKGESIHVNCTSDAKPAPVYSLYCNNVFHGSNGNGVFVVKLAENGNYTFTCVSNNTVGIGPSKSKSVTVRGPLIVTCKIGNEMITNKTVVEGSEVVLRLISSEMERLGFTWKNNTVNILGKVGHSLTIKSITRYQEGMYQVVARDRFNCSADMTCDFNLNNQYIDPLEVIGSSNKSYSQSIPLVLFNLSINASPNNTTLSCNPSASNILTTITSHDAGLTRKQYLVFVVIQNDLDSARIECKAENSVGVRERTLHFYRQPILFKETFTGQFRITNQEWQDDLQDVKSADYNDLKQKCIKIIEAAYFGVPYLAAVYIKDFIKGSIVVRFVLEVIGKVPDPLLPLRNYIKRQGEEINGLQIHHNSIQKSSDFKENTPISCKEENNTLVPVLGALFALSIVLSIIFIAGFLWLRRKDRTQVTREDK